MGFVFLLTSSWHFSSSANNLPAISEPINYKLATTSLAALDYVPAEAEKQAAPEIKKEILAPNDLYYQVVKVVDGDTIDIAIDSRTERLRLIGINTPEVVDPRKTVECFGREASANAKKLLAGAEVRIAADPSQDDRDKYGRLLRYVWRRDGLFYNLEAIKDGFAYEYTYKVPYIYQRDFKEAQKYAAENKLGLWAAGACGQKNISALAEKTAASSAGACLIKGNIGATGEKIYHLPACSYYKQTVINESQGEKYFCSEDEAMTAGWRKAKNCP